MTRTTFYRYMGTNGIIESPVHLEDVYYVRLVQLSADKGKTLTNGKITQRSILTTEEEAKNWKEIEA